MKATVYVLIYLAWGFGSCISWKKALVSSGNQNDAIHNAIIDFLHHDGFVKNDSVFVITVKNINSDVLAVSILGNKDKIAVITRDERNYSYYDFPTCFMEREGKLFYWKDSTKELSSELLTKLVSMNLVDTAVIGRYLPVTHIDDSQKEVDYFFCKNNLSIYKMVYTKKAIGWYDPPILSCPSNGTMRE